MKATLIIKLVSAHCSGSEEQFKYTLDELIKDEEKKGNTSLAMSLKNAYSNDIKNSSIIPNSSMVMESSTTQSLLYIPKDKDSALDLVNVYEPEVNLMDIALSEKVEASIKQILVEQNSYQKLSAAGITPTNRLLLCGPPGCGKTMTANAIAKQLNLPIAYVKLDGLVSSYLGQTGTNIRKIFEFVKDKRIMLFLDEFDAIAKRRDDSHELGELKRVVTTLLQNLDDMPSNVFLVAATNHHQLLDPAIWRRFDLSILLDLPNEPQRKCIIQNTKVKLFKDYEFDSKMLTVLTDGMNGAQICTFLQALAKYCVLNKERGCKLTIEEIGKIWLDYTALFISEDGNDFHNALVKLRNSGVSIRAIESITGIPKSTLSYRFKKEESVNAKG